MRLTDEQIRRYEEDGYLFLPNLFSQAEMNVLNAQLPALYGADTPDRVLEKKTGVVRALHGVHTRNEAFRRLAAHPRMVIPAMQVLQSKVYVHQFKVNAKAALAGEIWEWHQDFIFWQKEDGMPECQVTNVALFLDEVNEFNGPLLIIPGSHKLGVVSVDARHELAENYKGSPAWITNLTADLKYAIPRPVLAELAARRGMVAPKGPAGSVLIFHPNVVHGSSPNMSPFDRGLAIATYNSVENTPRPVANPRPDFLCSRDYTAIEPLADNALAELAAQR